MMFLHDFRLKPISPFKYDRKALRLYAPNRNDAPVSDDLPLGAGWRDGSIQPANYEPDLIILHKGTTPVIVDAKFRCGGSEDEFVAGDAAKEIQAYMDEFGRRSAIAVVPLIPRNRLTGDTCFREIVTDTTHLRHPKAMYVVELNPIRPQQFYNDFSNAFSACAAIENS
jgi:hypothetical protein